MSKQPITYGQLRNKLAELGFEAHEVERNGTRGHLLERNHPPKTRLYLPNYAEDDIVETFDMNSVLMALRSRQLLPENNPLLS